MVIKNIFFTFYYLGTAGYLIALLLYYYTRKIPFYIFSISFVFQSIGLLFRGWIPGFFIANPIFEEPFFLPWCIACITLIFFRNNKIHYTLILIVSLSILSIIFPHGAFSPSPKQNTILSPIFFFFEVMSHGHFILGGYIATISLFSKKIISNKQIDDLIIWGFIFYTIAQIIGAYWCYLGWTVPFHWGDRHLQSAAIWTYYAAYIHINFIGKPKTTEKLKFAILGFVIILLFIYSGQIKEINIHRLG